MAKIIELRRYQGPPAVPSGGDGDVAAVMSALEQSARGLLASAEHLVETLEASLACIRARIDSIPDAEVSARLEKEHAILSAALRDAKAKVVSLGLTHPRIRD
jgi:hypothetical protein